VLCRDVISYTAFYMDTNTLKIKHTVSIFMASYTFRYLQLNQTK